MHALREYSPAERAKLDELLGMPDGSELVLSQEEITQVRAIVEKPELHSDKSTVRLVAACMLAALETETHVDTTEQAVLKFMVARGLIKPDAPAHVEYGCLEHGFVHVCAWDDANKDRWWGLDPATGEIGEY